MAAVTDIDLLSCGARKFGGPSGAGMLLTFEAAPQRRHTDRSRAFFSDPDTDPTELAVIGAWSRCIQAVRVLAKTSRPWPRGSVVTAAITGTVTGAEIVGATVVVVVTEVESTTQDRMSSGRTLSTSARTPRQWNVIEESSLAKRASPRSKVAEVDPSARSGVVGDTKPVSVEKLQDS